ncbi:hypothetical protein ABPG74_008914 [Tetrahymena malaccensis]
MKNYIILITNQKDKSIIVKISISNKQINKQFMNCKNQSISFCFFVYIYLNNKIYNIKCTLLYQYIFFNQVASYLSTDTQKRNTKKQVKSQLYVLLTFNRIAISSFIKQLDLYDHAIFNFLYDISYLSIQNLIILAWHNSKINLSISYQNSFVNQIFFEDINLVKTSNYLDHSWLLKQTYYLVLRKKSIQLFLNSVFQKYQKFHFQILYFLSQKLQLYRPIDIVYLVILSLQILDRTKADCIYLSQQNQIRKTNEALTQIFQKI